ncbi:MAG: tetratricopeptide repeat protein, partial [Myxococcota bacterium]
EADLRVMVSSDLSQTSDRREQSRTEAERALAIARDLDDHPRIASAQLARAVALRRNNAPDEAREAFTDALAHAPPSPSALRGLVLLYSGVHERVHGDYADARRLCEAALDEAGRVGAEWLEVACLGMVGGVAIVQRRFADALHATERALAIHRREGDRRSEMLSIADVGITNLSMGNSARAREVLEQALAMAVELGTIHYEGRLNSLISKAQLALGEPEAALARTRTAIGLLRRGGYGVDEALARCNACGALRDLGRYDEALAEAGEALAGAERVKMPRALRRACDEHARALWLLDRPEEAVDWYARSVGHFPDSEVFAERALLAWQLGHRDAARDFAERGVALPTGAAQDVFAGCVHAFVHGRAPDLEALRKAPHEALAACAGAFEGQEVSGRSLARLVRKAVASV